MIETSTFRRVAATLTIGSFSIAALMGIVALLGGDFGERQGKVLLTTLVVGCASICMLCSLATSGTRWAPVGVAGAVAAVVPTATALHLVWRTWEHVPDDVELKVFGIGVVVAVTLAQVCLLLSLAGARESLQVVRWATVALAGAVAVIVSGMIIGSIGADGIWRVLGVAAILDVLGTLVTIALAKFGKEAQPDPLRSGRLRITLGEDQAAELEHLARRTGRSTDHLVAEAVDAYLRSEVRS